MPHKSDPGKAPVKAFAPGTILSGRTGAPVSFDELMADVRTARVVYVGEMHTSARHHEIQLKVIRALHDEGIRLAVGMEMFDRS
ncbi:MAG TPA: ChaN family lipoprotein, partial [Desulfobacterales bacterium]|nr:ChaN family lipoprotein [Desulfobacterales bacterium]